MGGPVAYLSTFLFSYLVAKSFVGVEADACAREWLQYQGNCYGYFDRKLTWEEAEIECQIFARGAHLASILTSAETLMVAQHISTYQKEQSDVWIGLHDIRRNGRWRWTDESTYNYKAWMLGTPDNLEENEHCAELKRSSVRARTAARDKQNTDEGECESLAITERPSESPDFTKWNDAKCQKLNAYICKHEL